MIETPHTEFSSVSKPNKADTLVNNSVLKIADYSLNDIQYLLSRYGLIIQLLEKDKTIIGSFWGDSEAGLVGNKVYARKDTPIHSLLHEACHYICMDNRRRLQLNTNAGGDYNEENAVCYLQILLANELPNISSERIMQDMDSWGYTFRLGSAKAWFENDAEDALTWLQDMKLLNTNNHPNYHLRK